MKSNALSKKQLQQGFTLIELIIVVAIIGILAAIAIPAYQDYTIRAQVSEGMSLADGAKTAIAEYYTNHGTWPTNNSAAGLASPQSITGKYVATVTVGQGTNGGGAITVCYGSSCSNAVSPAGAGANANINGDTIQLLATSQGGSIVWTCGPGTSNPVPKKYLPTSCQG